MALGARARRAALFVLLAATLAAAAWVGGRNESADDFPLARAAASRPDPAPGPAPDAGPAAAAEAPPAESRAANVRDIDLARLKRESQSPERAVDDAFARHTWYVPPPPPKPAPPARPAAPALPFHYMGRLTDGAKEIVFLTSKQDRNYSVSAGDTIDGTYRVDSITERSMTLTYLPLGQQQTLQLADSN